MGLIVDGAAHAEERRVVTAVFADLVGSTGMGEQLDAEDMRAILAAYLNAAASEIVRHEGTVEKFIGDAVVGVFGAPAAREDDADRALKAALGIRREVGRINRGSPPSSTQLAVRIGVNTGRVVAGDLPDAIQPTYLISGDAMNTAQRLEAAAQPDEILVGDITHRLTEAGFVFGEPRVIDAKGKKRPVHAYPLVGERAESLYEPLAVASHLVGRDRELAAIEHALARLRRGRGSVVAIVGDPGMGKTRLLAEARGLASGVRWLDGRAVRAGQRTRYAPFCDVILADAGQPSGEQHRDVWQRSAARISALLGPDDADTAAYIAALLGETEAAGASGVIYPGAEELGRQILRAARRYVQGLAREQPTVLAFDDWHWADAASEALLKHLIPATRASPLLIVVAGRHEPDSPMASLVDGLSPDVTMTLEPLEESSSRELIGNLLGTELPERVTRTVVGRTEGNPFFVEEVVRSLIDADLLVREPTGSWRLASDQTTVAVPDRVEAVIAARIDRLDEAQKEALRVASVIGRDFEYALLQSVADLDGKLDAALAVLVAMELIQEIQASSRAAYSFKHVLIQETAYGQVLGRRRRELHDRIARSLEAQPRGEDFSGALAFHYTRAENWAKAHEHLFAAGDRAAAVAADIEALSHYREALVAYQRAFGDRWDPTQRAALASKMGEALFRRGEHAAARDHLYSALADLGIRYPRTTGGVRLGLLRQLLQQLAHRVVPSLVLPRTAAPDPVGDLRVRILGTLAWADYYLSDNERFVLECLMALNEAERRGDKRGTGLSCFGLGVAADVIPLGGIGAWYFRRAADLAAEAQDPLLSAFSVLGLALNAQFHQGRASEATGGYELARTALRMIGETRQWGLPTLMSAWIHLGFDLRTAERLARELLDAGEGGADPQLTAWGRLLLGRLASRRGDHISADSHLRDAAAIAENVPDYPTLLAVWGDLAWSLLDQRRHDEALHLVDTARATIRARNLRTPFATRAIQARARAHLDLAAASHGRQRAIALRLAGSALRDCRSQSRFDSWSLPVTCRLAGTLWWVRGSQRRAQDLWRRGLVLADERQDRFEEGYTRLELARWTGDEESAAAGEATLLAIGIEPRGVMPPRGKAAGPSCE